MRILFDKNAPVGGRGFLGVHEVHTVVEMSWPPQLENGDLLNAAEVAAFDVMVTADQNIRYQQNLAGRKTAIAVKVDAAGSYAFIEMPLPPKPRGGLATR